ncbi:MAG: hypothetical protein QOC94_2881, partial [Actinoplanes sp.]|nr:hypothetical protein [Actinoplanes sp.]
QVLTTQERVKISFYGGYEHFERDTESDDAVYRWIGRTRVAE